MSIFTFNFTDEKMQVIKKLLSQAPTANHGACTETLT